MVALKSLKFKKKRLYVYVFAYFKPKISNPKYLPDRPTLSVMTFISQQAFLGALFWRVFFFHLNKITSNSFILFIDFLYKSKISDTRYLPAMHDDELVVIFRQDAIYAF